MKARESSDPPRLVITISEREARRLRDQILRLAELAEEDAVGALGDLADFLHIFISA